jgi:2-methylcitrate dehydratase PrpD
MKGGKQQKQVSQVIAEFLVKEKYDALPAATVQKAKEYTLDVIGCAVGASKETQVNILTEVLEAEGRGNPRSTVFNHGFKTSIMNAALFNGTMGHTFDYDDDHREGTMHPSVAVFPAVFALAEAQKATGKDFIRSFILGLEVMIRCGESLLGKSYYQGFHPTSTCGVFGAAAGCGNLLGFDVKRYQYALGLAGSFASGTMAWADSGSWQKPLQAGHPAMLGAFSALLAEKDFIGADTIFDGTNSIIRALSFKDQYDFGRITETLGKKWEMVDTSIKVHACCRFSGPVADCALDLYKQGVRSKDVKKITAKVSDFSIRTLCIPPEKKKKPITHVDAQFSIPWAVAVAICRNKTGINEFKEEVLQDPEMLALADKVTWELDPEAERVYPKAYPATLVAECNNGKTYQAHVDFPKGDPENPATYEDIVTKFHFLTEKYFSSEKRKKIIDTVNQIEKVSNIAQLADLLR